MLKLKKLLLDTDLVINNQYLDEYVELIINNYDSVKIKNTTQIHHSIPVFCYAADDINSSALKRKEAIKLASTKAKNI